jgi:hypothetical protein
MVYEPHIPLSNNNSSSETSSETSDDSSTEKFDIIKANTLLQYGNYENDEGDDSDDTDDSDNSDFDSGIGDTYNIHIRDLMQNYFYLYYNEQKEMQDEIDGYNYNLNKNTGNWLIAKTIISNSKKDKANSEFFWDYLELLFNGSDNFDNIKKIIYSANESVFEFDTTIAKYIVDNLKICKYKPNGYLFNNNTENNKWNFKIVVVTSKNIYSANRYIDETSIGCF